MLARAFGGRFADPGWPWIVAPGEDRGGNMRAHGYLLDADKLVDEAGIGPLSSGERTYLRLVVGLFGQAHVDLSDMAGLDRDLQALVLAGLSHAGGSHQHPGTVTAARRVAVTGDEPTVSLPVPGQYAGPLFPWPGQEVPVDGPHARHSQRAPVTAPGMNTDRPPTGPSQVPGLAQQKRAIPDKRTGSPMDR